MTKTIISVLTQILSFGLAQAIRNRRAEEQAQAKKKSRLIQALIDRLEKKKAENADTEAN